MRSSMASSPSEEEVLRQGQLLHQAAQSLDPCLDDVEAARKALDGGANLECKDVRPRVRHGAHDAAPALLLRRTGEGPAEGVRRGVVRGGGRAWDASVAPTLPPLRVVSRGAAAAPPPLAPLLRVV